ncbi:uncharacterized protein F4822DRAFT_418200 [Hypoxylon trugodes]|uniref:uncharacterized protein n=1 Tax=Hypoxylon trugodes TaxID=326681 RepID=UPI00219ACE47|nr:uncharacterized protein F4822DRAFT_418200 [Hypoxylon trugodes]KAI1383973.1 hypothetical protein F4822DRAFT_418200 [Hypoxylon trugodes]
MTATDGWDYIIIGGGLAGCALASRLHEHTPAARILILEAGPDVSDRKDILQFQSFNFIGGEFDWNYKTTPQKEYNGRQVDLASGRVLGGGSTVNGCAWTRGAKIDFDDWAAIVGDQRWSYEGQLPYFKKTEAWYKKSESHGSEGKLHIESPISTGRLYPLADQVEQSWADLGFKALPEYDMNAGQNIGLGELNENRHKGARQLANLAYPLDGVTTLTNVLVESVLTEGTTSLRATGVRLADGTEYRGKEVILSTGAYRTPQLLMLSGLGPRNVLTKHGIDVKLDLPSVGQNFNDHILLFLNWRLRDPLKAYALGSNHPRWGEPQYATGMPASYVASTTVPKDGLKDALARDGETDPNHYLLKNNYAMMENIVLYFSTAPLTPDGTHISTALMGMKPTSRGTVSIASKNPTDLPVLNPNYYSTEVDKYVWRTSLRKITSLMTGDTPLGRDVVAGETPQSGEPLSVDATDEYLDGRMKNQAISMFHGSGSCAMGTVVDSELRVKGVQNLRIVDASVFPVSIGAHIQAATYALAEQAAVLISGAA